MALLTWAWTITKAARPATSEGKAVDGPRAFLRPLPRSQAPSPQRRKDAVLCPCGLPDLVTHTNSDRTLSRPAQTAPQPQFPKRSVAGTTRSQAARSAILSHKVVA